MKYQRQTPSNMATTLDILQHLQAQYSQGRVLSPSQCLEQADKLNILRGADDDRLAELDSELSKVKAAYLEEDMTSAKAKVLVEATPEYLQYLKLKAHLNRVTEQIRILKARARAAGDEIKGY